MRTVSTSIVAPTGGWNTRDPLDQMQERFAIKLLNLYPEQGSVRTRNGYAQACNLSNTATVETLAELPLASGVSKLVAVCGGKIYEASGTTGVILESGIQDSKFQTTVMNGRLIMCNGIDAPRLYDGTSISVGTYNAFYPNDVLVPSKLVQVTQYKSRLYFVEKDSPNVWYGDTAAITGNLSKIDFSFLFHRGGNIAFIAPWSRDTGVGLADYLTIVSSEGEVLVYEGSDPTSAATFGIAARFFMPPPVAGRRGWVNLGSDLLIVHKSGITPLSALLGGGGNARFAAITDAISKSFLDAVTAYGDSQGWCAVYHPTGQSLYVNIPVTGAAEQYVLNPNTGAWGRYVGYNARCWSLLEDKVLFGGAEGRIYRADYGNTDNGTAIRSELKTAFNYFKDRGHIKRFTMARPIIYGPEGLSYTMGIDTNFNTGVSAPVTSSGGASAQWSVSLWDQSLWGGARLNSEDWYSLAALGRCASLSLGVETSTGSFELFTANITYEQGGLW
jgi:hypothetical protein